MAVVGAESLPRALLPPGRGAALDGKQAGVQVGLVYGNALVYCQGHEPADVHPRGSRSRHRGTS